MTSMRLEHGIRCYVIELFPTPIVLWYREFIERLSIRNVWGFYITDKYRIATYEEFLEMCYFFITLAFYASLLVKH